MKTVRGRSIIAITCFTALFAVLQWGCLEEIDLEAPAGATDALVIQGEVVKGDPSTIRVFVNRVFDFTGSTVRGLSVLSAEVTDEEGNTIRLDELALGVYGVDIYDGDPAFRIEIGKSYSLYVRARDGREYTTNFEPLLETPEIDSISLSRVIVQVNTPDGEVEESERFEFSVNTPLSLEGSSEPVLLTWDAERTFRVSDSPFDPMIDEKVCYVTDNVITDRFEVYDSEQSSLDYLSGFPVYRSAITPLYFSEGYYFTLYQRAISPGAYEYWRQASELINRSGLMFEAPAGKIVSNLYNPNDPNDEVYGYFYAYAQDTLRLYVSPEEAGNLRLRCPPPQGVLTENGTCRDPLCCDCLDHPDSSTERPDFWTE